MAKIRINPGACGLITTIRVKKNDRNNYSVQIESDCEMVEKLGTEITDLTMMDAFKKILCNPVYSHGSSCLRHVSCPVPSGILKTLEVEAGLAVNKGVTMEFIEDNQD